jgi:hypothetical protein
MFTTPRGAGSLAASLSQSDADARRTHDLAAYAAARDVAARELATLLAVLLAPTATPTGIEPRARTAMSAVGLLWETSARLNEN